MRRHSRTGAAVGGTGGRPGDGHCTCVATRVGEESRGRRGFGVQQANELALVQLELMPDDAGQVLDVDEGVLHVAEQRRFGVHQCVVGGGNAGQAS